MPNIRQIISLKQRYGKLNNGDKSTKRFIENAIVEEGQIIKGFSQRVVEHFDQSNLTTSLIDYFKSKPTEEVVLLFIDIAGFSKIVESEEPEFISDYLDRYYQQAFPIIYKNGGQIEKLMGDGIICVFGEPFISVDWPEEFNRAELCAKQLIEKFEGTNKAVKIALHDGKITYYKTPGTDYEEYTMIGKPLTELYRLESVSKVNAINFYRNSLYDNVINPKESVLGFSEFDKDEISLYGFNIELPGVAYKRIRYIKFK